MPGGTTSIASVTAPIGFTFHITLAVSRMFLSGFFDRCTRLKIIAAHAGVAPGAAMLRVRMVEASCRQLICIKCRGRVPTMLLAAPRERFSLCEQSVLPTSC